MRIALFSIALSIASVMAAYLGLVAVKQAFENAHIPQDLHITFEPIAELRVTYRQSGTESQLPIVVQPGMVLSKNATALPPWYNLNVSPAKVGHGPFVLVMVDPDVPTPQNPSVAQIRHFLGGNFFVERHGHLSNHTPAITEYEGPRPADISDPHRYIFLLFDQPPRFDDQKIITPTTDRRYFNISSFAKEVGLRDPLAGMFFYTGPRT